MCIVCSPEFANAFRALGFPSRRAFLRTAAATTAGAVVAEAVGPALADGSLGETLAAGLSTPPATIFVAKKIVTMERDNPTAAAVAAANAAVDRAAVEEAMETA